MSSAAPVDSAGGGDEVPATGSSPEGAAGVEAPWAPGEEVFLVVNNPFRS